MRGLYILSTLNVYNHVVQKSILAFSSLIPLLLPLPVPLNLPVPEVPATDDAFEFEALLCGGFLVPPEAYMTWGQRIKQGFPNSSVSCISDGSTINNPLSLSQSAIHLTQVLQKEAPRCKSRVLFGHSRGGTVALLCLLLRPELSEDISSLVLIDPVDDDKNTLIQLLLESKAPLPPILLLSTPYGGSSKYYASASFTSACAPPGRNAQAIYEAFQRSQRGSICELLVLPELGHFQLLDKKMLDRLDVVSASACAENTHFATQDGLLRVQSRAFNEIFSFVRSHLR